jgi:hypothetical protein
MSDSNSQASASPTPHITELWRYPVKSLLGERLATLRLVAWGRRRSHVGHSRPWRWSNSDGPTRAAVAVCFLTRRSQRGPRDHPAGRPGADRTGAPSRAGQGREHIQDAASNPRRRSRHVDAGRTSRVHLRGRPGAARVGTVRHRGFVVDVPRTRPRCDDPKWFQSTKGSGDVNSRRPRGLGTHAVDALRLHRRSAMWISSAREALPQCPSRSSIVASRCLTVLTWISSR